MEHEQQAYGGAGAGPIPGEFSLLSISACEVFDPTNTFACELKPINRNADPKALEVARLSLDELARTGLDPSEAMRRFKDWLSFLPKEHERLGIRDVFLQHLAAHFPARTDEFDERRVLRIRKLSGLAGDNLHVVLIR